MGEEFIIFLRILFSFFCVVGFIYVFSEIYEFLRYPKRSLGLTLSINADDYSYEEILTVLKAFSSLMNNTAAKYLFSTVTVFTQSETHSQDLAEYLGRYAAFADIQKEQE